MPVSEAGAVMLLAANDYPYLRPRIVREPDFEGFEKVRLTLDGFDRKPQRRRRP